MKKLFVTLFVLLNVVFVFAQNRLESAEIVIMMDTSGTILPYYEDINKKVLNEINSKFIRIGDILHLISFNANARHEVSQKIQSEADLSRIVSRFMLLYQLGHNSDLISAFDYGKSFTQNLETSNKEKILIVISDGIFNPPESSKYKNYNPDQLKNKISTIANDLRNNNWKVYFVKLPFPDNVVIRTLDGKTISGIAETIKSKENSNKDSEKSKITINDSDTEDFDDLKNNDLKPESQNIDSHTISENSAISNVENQISKNDFPEKQVTENTTNEKNGRQSSKINDWESSLNENIIKNEHNENPNSKNSDSYTDISSEVSESLGIKTSDLDISKPLSIQDDNVKLPRVQFPLSLETFGRTLNIPFKITNDSDETVELELESVLISTETVGSSATLNVSDCNIVIPPGETISVDAKTNFPKNSFPKGSHNASVRLNFADNKRVLPQVANLGLKVNSTWFEKIYDSGYFWIYVGIIALVLFLLLLFLFLYLGRRKAYSVSSAINSASSTETLNDFRATSSEQSKVNYKMSDEYKNHLIEQNREEAKARSMLLNQTSHNNATQYTEQRLRVSRNQSGMTELYVFNQSRAIGKRNIHVMKPNSELSVGGGKHDDFLIFLVRFPSNLASIRYDGRDYHLYIKKAKYFPYAKTTTISSCIGKTITVVSDKGYHVGFTFREYEDPISNLNSILTSIDYS